MKLLAKIGVFSMLGIAMSYAQPKTDAEVGVGVSGTVSGKVSAQLSFPDMLAQAKAVREQMQKDWRHVKHLQETARKEKDVIKLNCVNDKLVQIKPQMNIGDQARVTLETSSETDDRGTLFTEVTMSGENVRRLREEADQCIGEPTLATESQSGFTAPDVPDSPYDDPFDPGVEPPGYASPYN
jgi:hypothetical protein